MHEISKLFQDDVWDMAEKKARMKRAEIEKDIKTLYDAFLDEDEDKLELLIEEYREEYERIRRYLILIRMRVSTGVWPEKKYIDLIFEVIDRLDTASNFRLFF